MAIKVFSNGLKLSVIPKKDAKLISVDLYITSGTQSEKNYESGISEFTSKMLLMGTSEHGSRRALLDNAKNNGVLLSSDSTAEAMIVSTLTVKENVKKAIDILYDVAFNSLFKTEAGDAVRNQMLSDTLKLQENPSYVLERMVNQALYYRTGLANPKMGTVTTLSRMKSSDSKEFLNRVLAPKNTIISIVGDVDFDEVAQLVENTFNFKFDQKQDYRKLKYVAKVEDFVGGERTKNKKLNQSRINLAFPGLSFKDGNKYTVSIIIPILLRKLRDGLKDAEYFHSEKVSHVTYANNGKFLIEAMVDFEHVEEYLDDVADVIKELLTIGISEKEFEIEKNAFIIEFLESSEKASDLNLTACKHLAIMKQGYNLQSELLKVELIKAIDANKVLDKIFDFSKLFIAYLGNSTNIDASNYVD